MREKVIIDKSELWNIMKIAAGAIEHQTHPDHSGILLKLFYNKLNEYEIYRI